MPVVAGGSKTNLIVASDITDTTHVNFGRHRILAQTFTLENTYHIFRCLLKQWTTQGGEIYHYSIFPTAPDGKPAFPFIAHTTLSPTGESFYSPGKWRRFDFSSFPLLEPGLYALIASVPWASNSSRYKLRCTEPPNIYPDGKAWLSNDDGDTWEEVENRTFLFQVWGYQPPPAPPPPPVISNWAIQDLEQIQLTDGYLFVAHTNIPCHLFMRWTTVKPQIHRIPVYRRGVQWRTDNRFCFVVWKENEQAEAGDTLIHTFEKREWPICQTRWFYFVGTKQAEQQPSTSPIFTKHFERKGWIQIFYEPWTPPYYHLIFLEEWEE